MSKELKFEEAMEELENITKELESNDLTLEESVSKFKSGMDLAAHCNELLQKADKDISILLEKNDGSLIEEKFDINAEEEQ